MSLVPFGWSTVVVGRWNPAILTPAGISARLYGLPEGAPVEVMVPLDGLAPYLVKHPQKPIQASTDGKRLYITVMQDFTVAHLEDTFGFARNALCSLPETPVTAAGYNIKFRVTESDPSAAELLDAGPVDAAVSNAGHSIVSRAVQRSLAYPPGRLNVALTGNGEMEIEVSFNFHCEATDPHILREWLQPSVPPPASWTQV